MHRFAIVIGIMGAERLFAEYQYHQLKKRFTKTNNLVLAEAEMIQYLADIIDQHQIPLTEFDSIAIHAIADQINES